MHSVWILHIPLYYIYVYVVVCMYYVLAMIRCRVKEEVGVIQYSVSGTTSRTGAAAQ